MDDNQHRVDHATKILPPAGTRPYMRDQVSRSYPRGCVSLRHPGISFGRTLPAGGDAGTDGTSGSAHGSREKRTNRANSSGSRDAPPTRAPSISGRAMRAAMLPGFTLPP